MKKNNKQYGLLTRTSAALLGALFLFMSSYICYNFLCSPSDASLIHLSSLPMIIFGYLLLNTAWLGEDPLWFYKMWDVQEKSDE